MSCITPGTTSPGRLVLSYHDTITGDVHKIGWHFISGVAIGVIPPIRAEAVRLTGLLQPCLTTQLMIDAWSIILPNNTAFYTEALVAPLTGTHGLASGMQRWRSTTVRIEGTAHAPSPGVCYGRTNCVIFNQGALFFAAGQKAFDANSDGAYKTFINSGLNASTFLPADTFGQQADMALLMPVQWNAHAQKELGS